MSDDLWPPKPFDVAASQYAVYDAWLRTDPDALSKVYEDTSALVRAGQAVRGLWRRMFHGQPVEATQNQSRMLVSTATEVTTTLADLLFSEKPTIRFARPADHVAEKGTDGKPVRWEHPQQARLDELMSSDEAHAEYLLNCEYSAGLGDGYLAVYWDKENPKQKPLVKAFPADAAVPEFQGNTLAAVTLWTQYEKGSDVFRLLERHDLGVISYTLYKGGAKNLGEVVPLASLAETVHLSLLRSEADYTILEAGGEWSETVTVATGVPDLLTVVRIPFAMPNWAWRKKGALAHLGRSALAGHEDLLDKIDRVNSSMARDFDNGQSRIFVDESTLHTGKPGEGASFDVDQQVYVKTSGLGSATDGNQVQLIQPDIRVDVHEKGLAFWKRQLASQIGISPTHLGLKDSQGTRTATEVAADMSDSERTRDKMALYARPALARLAKVMLAVDAVQFPAQHGKRVEEYPSVEFAPVSQPDPEKQTRVTQLAWASQSMSLEERVRYLHDDWDDDEVALEAERIRVEFGIPTEETEVIDPTQPIIPADEEDDE